MLCSPPKINQCFTGTSFSSSGSKHKLSKKPVTGKQEVCLRLPVTGFLLGVLVNTEVEGNMYFPNVN
jgi:hypothetical protein